MFAMSKGQERWSMIDPNTWDMILGKVAITRYVSSRNCRTCQIEKF